jgi:hypothetical protein
MAVDVALNRKKQNVIRSLEDAGISFLFVSALANPR